MTAVNAGGSSTPAGPVSGTTLPAAPSAVVASGVSAGSVLVHWTNTSHGATGFIPFRNWTTGAVGGLFAKAFHFFSLHREEFLTHYHKRSNVETAVMMIKSKFGDSVRSKTEVAMRNEVLCKILCHNICCLISAMYELGIEPKFLSA